MNSEGDKIKRTVIGKIFIRLRNKFLEVEKLNMEITIGKEITPVTFRTIDPETEEKSEMTINVDSNLAHDLIEFSDLETQDVFIITLGEEAEWKTIAEEEWKLFLEREKKRDN